MNLINYFAPFIGLVTLAIGVCAVIRPAQMAPKFGVPADSKGLPYVMSTGIRDVFIGLTVLVLFYLQDWVALGLINFCIGIVAFSDFIVVRKHGNQKTANFHLAGMIAVIVYGIWLLA